MKIAYIFHGHARTWKQCYENFFNNVYAVAPGDIFIHTWDRTNPIVGSYWNGWGYLTGEALKAALATPDISGIFEAYKPKVLMVEQDKLPDLSRYKNPNEIPYNAPGCFGVKLMLESSRKAFETMKSYGVYDRVFSTRLDLNYESKLNINEVQSDRLVGASTDGNFDIWMMGTTEQMDIKTQYVNHIDTYWYDRDMINMHYEGALLKYLQDNNLGDFITSDISYTTPRIF
jgi:hypothetical protein